MDPPSARQTVKEALPGTIHQLVKKSGLTESCIRRWLRDMRDKKEAHISAYKRTAGLWTPLWVLGIGSDAKKPKPLTSAHYCRMWRNKNRRDNAEFKEAAKRAKKAADEAAKTPHDWLSALRM